MYCKCMKWKNIKSLLRLAVINDRLTEQQAEFLEKEFAEKSNLQKMTNLLYAILLF